MAIENPYSPVPIPAATNVAANKANAPVHIRRHAMDPRSIGRRCPPNHHNNDHAAMNPSNSMSSPETY